MRVFVFHGLTWRAAQNRHDSPSMVRVQVFGLGAFTERYTPIMPSKHKVLMHVFNDRSCGFVLVTFTTPAMKSPVIYCPCTRFSQSQSSYHLHLLFLHHISHRIFLHQIWLGTHLSSLFPLVDAQQWGLLLCLPTLFGLTTIV